MLVNGYSSLGIFVNDTNELRIKYEYTNFAIRTFEPIRNSLMPKIKATFQS